MVYQYGLISFVSLKTLLQHICVSVPDKADYRCKVVGVIVSLMNLFSDDMYVNFIQWLYKLSRNVKVSYMYFDICT